MSCTVWWQRVAYGFVPVVIIRASTLPQAAAESRSADALASSPAEWK
jgi:hypothetical protein